MPLSEAQLARMSSLLDEALPLDETDRRLWLEKVAFENADLVEALRKALLPKGDEPSVLNRFATLPKFEFDDDSTETASGLQPCAAVGPYELVRLLGSGGMAEVWLARRADGVFKRDVALKLPTLTGK